MKDKCQFIASEIIRILYEKPAITSCKGRFYNTQLIAYHSVDPARMAVVADGYTGQSVPEETEE